MQLNEKTGLYENYGAWHIPFWQTDSFCLGVKVCVIVVLCMLVGLLIKVCVRYKRNKKRTPWQKALKDIYQLKHEHKLYSENGKEFYRTISCIIKNYFYERFNYGIAGKTDTEFVEFLSKNYANDYIVKEVKELLHGGIFVKFANAHVAQDRINKDYERVIAIITLTIPEKNK